MDKERLRQRMEFGVDRKAIEAAGECRGIWYESAEDVEAGLDWGARKAALLRWVRRQMGRQLTPRERRCIELYYFQGMTFQAVGEATGIDASNACRSVHRALLKLKMAAQEDGSWRKHLKGSRARLIPPGAERPKRRPR
jgi:RNA polymerase sigma factor (sigma-70 family)